MSRDLLLERLGSLSPLTARGCFVLLWTYLDAERLKVAENLSRFQNRHPFRIEGLVPTGKNPVERLRSTISDLAGQAGAAFELLAVRWLKSLDRELSQLSDEGVSDEEFVGLDGLAYRVCYRRSFLADSLKTNLRGFERQSAARDLYATGMKAVPSQVAGTRIEVRPPARWGSPILHRRFSAERLDLTVLLWPLSTFLEYRNGPDEGDFVRLHAVENDGAVQAELCAATEAARSLRATLLVLPELALTPASLQELRRLLHANGAAGFPLLTLAGCCHCPTGDGRLDHNEAVLLGPDGSELHRHRKLSAFTGFSSDPASFRGERLEVGDRISVLESALGNLCPLICLDLFHEPSRAALEASHANLLVVPSLSSKTTAHRDAARRYRVSLKASTFVCNRSFERVAATGEGGLGAAPEAASFYQLSDRTEAVCQSASQEGHFHFNLRAEMDRTAKRQV